MITKLYLVLGCFGRTDDGFVSCNSIKNKILEIDLKNPNYVDLLNYLDNLSLFDRKLLEYNAIRHCIFKIQNDFELPGRKLWSEKMFTLYQKFTLDHKNCGLFLELEIE